MYIHNVYAPVENQEKQVFFDHLPLDDFEDNSTHLVLGDLNTPLDPCVDSSDPRGASGSGRSACLSWLGQLGVIDAWRVHHPDDRVFTGPQPRRNRLDYILLSEEFCNALYGDSKYFEPKGAGDHLAHSVTLRTLAQVHGHGYWRFQPSLLEFPDVVDAIRGEVEMLLPRIRASPNPGKVWLKWKKMIKVRLRALQRKLRLQQESEVADARTSLERTATRFREERSDATQVAFQTALAAYHDCVDRSRAYNQDTAFDFQARHAETSSKFFFRPLDGSLRRVSIEEVRVPDGELSSNPADISMAFRDHWGSIMGDPASGQGRPSDPPDSLMEELLSTIDTRLSDTQRDLLNAPLSGGDLAAAIKKMRAGSAPGMDGLPAAFYQLSPALFGEILAVVFNYQLGRGELLPCQRQSAISLLHKKGRDPIQATIVQLHSWASM